MEKQSTSKKLDICDFGGAGYKMMWSLQQHLLDERIEGNVNDSLLIVEHPHTYTLGKTADPKNLIFDEVHLRKNKISVFNIDRGGDITYHGPGQIVGYPIIDLALWKKDTHLYLRNLEEVIIQTCAEFGIKCGRKEKFTGVWIGERKIAAIGIKVNRWVTMHGFAFNVNTDLNKFDGIIPCGIKEKEVTSLQKELKSEQNLNHVKDILVSNFVRLFGYDSYTILKPDIFQKFFEDLEGD